MEPTNKTPARKLEIKLRQAYQRISDRIVPFRAIRWIVFTLFMILFYIRVIYVLQGFFVVAYGVSIHMIYLLVLMITPLSDPEDHVDPGGLLPTAGSRRGTEDVKAWTPKGLEFKVWRSVLKVLLVGYGCTLFGVFDIPVFWPILVMYFLVLFVTLIGGRVQDMVSKKYVPWTTNKPKYVSKE